MMNLLLVFVSFGPRRWRALLKFYSLPNSLRRLSSHCQRACGRLHPTISFAISPPPAPTTASAQQPACRHIPSTNLTHTGPPFCSDHYPPSECCVDRQRGCWDGRAISVARVIRASFGVTKFPSTLGPATPDNRASNANGLAFVRPRTGAELGRVVLYSLFIPLFPRHRALATPVMNASINENFCFAFKCFTPRIRKRPMLIGEPHLTSVTQKFRRRGPDLKT